MIRVATDQTFDIFPESNRYYKANNKVVAEILPTNSDVLKQVEQDVCDE